MTKPKTATIDGQEYELVPKYTNVASSDNPKAIARLDGYWLKPITAADKKHIYKLELGFESGTAADNHWTLSEDIELTEPQATVLADAIGALVDWVQNYHDRPEYSSSPSIVDLGNDFSKMLRKARSVFHE